MSHPPSHSPGHPPDPQTTYQIRIGGHLSAYWAAWFDSLEITLEEGGTTLLTYTGADQAALHGVLRKVRDLGLPLLTLTRTDPK